MNLNSEYIYSIIAKSLTERLSEAETTELEKWKQTDSKNLQEYNDLVSLWYQSASLKMASPTDQTEALQHLRKKLGVRSSKKRWMSRAVQAAAILVLSLLISGAYNYFNANQPETVSSAINHAVFQEIKASCGTQAKVELADGTTVFLNSGSKLRFPQTFENQKQRIVELDGEGFFEVKKDEKIPFIVETQQLNIKVMGTTFNVDAYSDNQTVHVALVEGKVMLKRRLCEKNQNLLELSPNQLATLNTSTNALVKENVESLYKYTAWTNGRIVFFDDPIQTIVKKLEKWYNVDIIIADKRLESYKFTGTFFDESLEQVLKVLSLTSPMKYEIRPGEKQADNSLSKRKIILKSTR